MAGRRGSLAPPLGAAAFDATAATTIKIIAEPAKGHALRDKGSWRAWKGGHGMAIENTATEGSESRMPRPGAQDSAPLAFVFLLVHSPLRMVWREPALRRAR